MATTASNGTREGPTESPRTTPAPALGRDERGHPVYGDDAPEDGWTGTTADHRPVGPALPRREPAATSGPPPGGQPVGESAGPPERRESGEVKRRMAVSEAVLIARAQAGDHTAFETIFNQYQTAIYNYVYRLMGSAEDAYDLTQDTFLKAYLALPKTSDDLRVGAWLYRIATNVCLDELRHRKLVKWQPWEAFISVFHPSQVAKDSPERDCIDRENTEEVQLILDRLHPKYRLCLILREYHDLSYDEIAEVLNTTRAAVKSLLFRAREEFRQVYAKVERQPGRAQAV
jgi:RNA polymerase sigma-70 factor, ECF subfamily